MWTIAFKDGKAIKAGKDIIIDGTFDSFVVTEELYAKQAEKFEYIDGTFRLIEGETLQTLEELNKGDEQPPILPETMIVIPENVQPLFTESE